MKYGGDNVRAVWVEDHKKTRASRLDGLAHHWRQAPRRWGHPLHSLCSYFAMFPPHIPRVFVEWLTAPGDMIYDPFSGRGTAPLEACRLGRVGLGSDANPLAYVLTGAKVNPPTINDVLTRLEMLRKSMPLRKRWNAPADIEMLYSWKVLRQLCWLRTQLDIEERTDRFIMSTILGMMHANYKPGSPARGFSISMPNTFSMSPNYVRQYIEEQQLRPPDVDVFDMVQHKIGRMAVPGADAMRGTAWKADARKLDRAFEKRVRLVFTSPPYLSVIKYGKYNWVRLWMLGLQPRAVDNDLVATGSLRRYLDFIDEVLVSMRGVVDTCGYVCLMLGDVSNKTTESTLNLAETVWINCAAPSGWRRLGIVNDYLPQEHKVSRIWGHERKGHATKVDRILILAPPNSHHVLPASPRGFLWNSANAWASTQMEGC